MIDYKAYNIPNKNFQNATVATYQMDFGKGRVINLGIWGHIVENNQAFLKYLDNVFIPFTLAENHLGEALAQSAMVVDDGVSKVLRRPLS